MMANNQIRRESSIGHQLGLLLTSAVTPDPRLRSSEHSPATRMAEYDRGIASWRGFAEVGPIVVCDGSDFPESAFRTALREARDLPFEYLPFRPSTEVGRGKGAAELELIAHALQASSLRTVRRVIKATGRYGVQNASQIVALLQSRATDAAVCANLVPRAFMADSRVFVFTPQFFFAELYPLRGEIDDERGVWLEHVLFRALTEHPAESAPLPLPLRLSGRAGTTGDVLDESSLKYIARRIRHRLRSVTAQ